jgi:hypothetical protein
VRIAAYTAIMGGYDKLQPHVEVPGIDWYAFIEGPSPAEPTPWRTDWRITWTPPADNPRPDAKTYKVLGPEMWFADYDATVWLDGSHEVSDARFFEIALASLGPDGFALHRHPMRDCIYEEAAASIAYPLKYGGMPIAQQVEAYRAAGHPEHAGLWACGSIARVVSPKMDCLMRAWWHEIVTWSVQDQISLPFVCRVAGVQPVAFPWDQYQNPYVRIHRHTDGT